MLGSGTLRSAAPKTQVQTILPKTYRQLSTSAVAKSVENAAHERKEESSTRKGTSEAFSADTPFSSALWYATLGSAAVFAAYLAFRGWTDYFSPSAKQDAEAAVRSIPLIEGNPVVFIDLEFEGKDLGRLVLQLRKDIAPRTSENFRRLCTGERGFGLRGSRFHALVPGSYLTGGDLVHGTGEGGKSALGVPFPPEKNDLRHIGPGVLSMAGPGPDYTSQFAVSLGKAPLMDGKFPTFGNVVSGFDVLHAAEAAISDHQGKATAGSRRPALIVKDCGQLLTRRRPVLLQAPVESSKSMPER